MQTPLLPPHQEHSPEPWLAAPCYGAIVSSQTHPGQRADRDDLSSYGGWLIGEGISPINRRRILACVNAMRGIPTERLEQAYACSDSWFSLADLGTFLKVEAQRLYDEQHPDEPRTLPF